MWLGEFAALTDAGFTNGCSCRLHGQSSIVPDGLNLALHVGDDVELVLANRRLYAAALRVDPDGFTTCAQVHGTKVVAVTKELVGSGALAYADTIADTDALITDLPDVSCCCFMPTVYRCCWQIPRPAPWVWPMRVGVAVWAR